MDVNSRNWKQVTQMNMELTFPEDRREARARSDRNLSGVERYASIAAGAGMVMYGASRMKWSGLMYVGLGAVLLRRGITSHCDIYEALAINTSDVSGDTRAALRGARGVNVFERVTIDRPIDDLYRFWRNLENLPQFMRHLESVEKITDTISHWRAKGPGATVVEWDAEINNEVPNQVIGWRSLEGADVVSAGSVNFDRASDGSTWLTVHLQYSPPAGKVGAAVARLFGRDPGTEIRQDLRRFKDLIETGRAPAAPRRSEELS
ncbi:MAG TPA: SRPBCC family protein [Vicinamibacterales bacterium]